MLAADVCPLVRHGRSKRRLTLAPRATHAWVLGRSVRDCKPGLPPQKTQHCTPPFIQEHPSLPGVGARREVRARRVPSKQGTITHNARSAASDAVEGANQVRKVARGWHLRALRFRTQYVDEKSRCLPDHSAPATYYLTRRAENARKFWEKVAGFQMIPTSFSLGKPRGVVHFSTGKHCPTPSAGLSL